VAVHPTSSVKVTTASSRVKTAQPPILVLLMRSVSLPATLPVSVSVLMDLNFCLTENVEQFLSVETGILALREQSVKTNLEVMNASVPLTPLEILM